MVTIASWVLSPSSARNTVTNVEASRGSCIVVVVQARGSMVMAA